ncbi:hypothetical protein KI688_007959 [Linnemannia hyalina]|uniref:WD40 repeat-like protein n=1 Tax=Linnemannia hyalina TaxID=64524 RepID=A0A9P7Y233_9FUNG|nr:hypothetical protein KI688_007959 [Linnemannia hyalina]
MSMNSRSTPSGQPSQPLSPVRPNAGHDDDNNSVSSQRIRKRDKIFNLFRSSSQEHKAKNTGSTSPKSSIKGASAASTELSVHHFSTVSTPESVDIEQAVSTTAVKSTPSIVHPSTLLTKPRLDVFSQNVNAPAVRIPLPAFGARIDTTPQLALCIGLLSKVHDAVGQRKDPSQDLPSDTAARLAWVKAMKQDPTERERLFWLGTRMVDEFAKDAFKDSTEIAEMVLIGPVMNMEHYRGLLSSIIAAFDHSVILSVDLLQGLVQLVQSAPPESLLSDDLVKILRLLRLRLQDTHQQSTVHPFHLTLALSRVLDVMADHKVKDLSRVEEREPLSGVLSSLTGSSDPYLMYQACYAFQALQYVPDDETVLQAVLRQSIGVAGGLVKISAVMKLDVGAVLEGLDKLQEAIGSTVEIAGTLYEGFCSLKESGRGVFDSLKEGYGSGKKRPWYAAVRAAHALAHSGQLHDLNRLICMAPCRRDPLFQWGICQLLGEIASDDIWDSPVRQQAVELLGDLFQNDPLWGEDESVRTWMLNISGQLGAVDDAAVSSSAIALVKELQQVQPATTKLPYPLRNRLPLPTSSPTLVKVQKIPPLEYDLHRLRMLRLKQSHQDVYIPPMAKPSLKAKDEDIFLLMEKMQEFLAGERQVMLVLGDSGAGKSTFNCHLEHRLWTDYKPGDPIPLFINLPSIDHPDQELVVKQLRIHSFSDDQIMEIKLHRQLILICDGYDESQQLVNLHRTNSLNQPGQWNTKMVISCRTQFLGPEYHSRFMPQSEGGHYDRPAPHLFQEAVIAPFSKAQIENYVEQYVPLEPRTWDTKDYMDRLTTIPNLLDLVRNPFLLSLSLEALPGVTEGKQDLSTIEITRAHLYDTFVNHWLDVNKRRLERNNALSMEDRDMLNQLVSAGFNSLGLDYATKLARAIFDRQEGKPVVKYVHLSDKNTWKAEFFGPQPEIRLLRESSPLTRAGNQFRFVHRSMLEYFLSRAIYDPIKADNEDDEEDDAESDECCSRSLFDVKGPLFRRNLLPESSIIQFLCDRVKSNPDFEHQLRAVIDLSKTDESAAIAATNAITILVRAGVLFNGADLRGVNIPGADLTEGQFDSAQFQGANLTGADLSRSWLRQADLSGAQLKDVRFGELAYLEMESEVMFCTYSPDGTMLAAGLGEDGVDVYSTTSWTRVLQIRDIGLVFSVVFSPDSQQIAFGGKDQTVRVWDVTSDEELLAMKGHTEVIYSVDYSPCGKLIASAGYEKTVRLWSSQTGECLLVLEDHTRGVMGVKFSSDGRQLVSVDGEAIIRFWDAETGELVREFDAPFEINMCRAYSPDGKWIAFTQGRSLQLWDAVSYEPGPALQGHTSDVKGVAFSPNGQWIASASEDKTVRLWDASTGTPTLVLFGHNETVRSVAFSPNGLRIASGGFDKKVRLWDLSSSWSSVEPEGHRVDRLFKAAYSFDGLSILGASDRSVQQWDSATGRSLPNAFQFPELVSVRDVDFYPELLSVRNVDFSPDGNQIAAVVENSYVQVWDLLTCAAGSVFKVEQFALTIVAYSPCGRWVAAWGWKASIWLWDLHDTTVKEHHVIIDIENNGGFGRSTVTFSSAGHQLAIGFSDGSVRVFDPQSGNLLSSLQLEQEAVGALAYSPIGQQLAVGGGNGSIYLWDGQSQEPSIQLDGHNARIFSVAYSPCGQWIASGGGDRTVRLWGRWQEGELEYWQSKCVVRGFFVDILNISWNPVTPMEFVTHGHGESVRVWRVSIDGESVVVRMLWGFNKRILCAEGLISKDATDLSPMNQKLLVQRGAVDSSLVHEGEGSGA